MPVDTSIYQNLRPFEMPDMMGAATKAMTLSQLAAQNRRLQRDEADDQAIKDIYAQHMGEDGRLSGQGLSALHKINPMKAVEYQANNQKLDASSMELAQKRTQAIGGALDALYALPEQERAKQYPIVRNQLIRSGMIQPNQALEIYDRDDFERQVQSFRASPEYLDRQQKIANIAKTKREAARGNGLSLNEQLAIERLNDQRTARKDKAIEGIAHKLGNSQEIGSAIGSVEKQLGFNLDDWDPNEKVAAKLGKDGKPVTTSVDVPGVSIPFIGRVNPTESARKLETAVARVFNTELKDRSGAAVTTPELERLRTEFGAGAFNNESELISALQAYKAAARDAMRNVELGAPPEALAEYRERGGFVSDSMRGGNLLKSAQNKTKQSSVGTTEAFAGSDTPGVRMQGPDGQIRIIPKDKVGEAITAGGKKVK